MRAFIVTAMQLAATGLLVLGAVLVAVPLGLVVAGVGAALWSEAVRRG